MIPNRIIAVEYQMKSHEFTRLVYEPRGSTSPSPEKISKYPNILWSIAMIKCEIGDDR